MLWIAVAIIPYLLIILTGWYGLSHNKKATLPQQVKESDLLSVSVIVAFKNEEDTLPSLLSDLRNINYPPDKLQVILVDDSSADSSYSIVSAYAQSFSNLLLISNEGSGKKDAISSALKIAGGELILTTDADCRVSPGWVIGLSTACLKEDADLVIGPVEPVPGTGFFGSLTELEFISLQAVTAGLASVGHPVMCNGANLGFRKSLTNSYKEFIRPGILSGDDMFMLHHAKKMHSKIIWLNDNSSLVKTSLPGSMSGFFKQRARWASKSVYYHDTDTIVTGLATAIANLTIVAVSVMIIFIPALWKLLAMLLLAKSIPDLLILSTYLNRVQKRGLLKWFVPTAILYPYYIIITSLISLFRRSGW